MKHRHWWCNVFWNPKCPPCKVRQARMLGRSGQMSQAGLTNSVYNNPYFTNDEKLWVLRQVRIIED